MHQEVHVLHNYFLLVVSRRCYPHEVLVGQKRNYVSLATLPTMVAYLAEHIASYPGGCSYDISSYNDMIHACALIWESASIVKRIDTNAITASPILRFQFVVDIPLWANIGQRRQ